MWNEAASILPSDSDERPACCRYRAPERSLLDNEDPIPYGTPADVFSFGVLIYEASSGKVAALEYGAGPDADPRIQSAYRKGKALRAIDDSSLCPVWLAFIWERCTSSMPGSRPAMGDIVVRS